MDDIYWVNCGYKLIMVVVVGLKLADLVDLIWFIVLNVTFGNISTISWRPVLVVAEDRVPGENHRPWASNW
jgi:hypothetical protein